MNELLSYFFFLRNLPISSFSGTYPLQFNPEQEVSQAESKRNPLLPFLVERLRPFPDPLLYSRAAPLLISQFHFLCIAFPSGTVNEEKKELRMIR